MHLKTGARRGGRGGGVRRDGGGEDEDRMVIILMVIGSPAFTPVMKIVPRTGLRR
jgi:hypothetical protein